MLRSSDTYLINNVDEFLSCFSSKVSSDSETGWGVDEGSDDRTELGREGVCHVGAIFKWRGEWVDRRHIYSFGGGIIRNEFLTTAVVPGEGIRV